MLSQGAAEWYFRKLLLLPRKTKKFSRQPPIYHTAVFECLIFILSVQQPDKVGGNVILLSMQGTEVQAHFFSAEELIRRQKKEKKSFATAIPPKLSALLMMSYTVPHARGSIRCLYLYPS